MASVHSFSEGDRVRVLEKRSVGGYAAWGGSDMTETVGKIFKILSCEKNGIMLDTASHGFGMNYTYAPHVLSKSIQRPTKKEELLLL